MRDSSAGLSAAHAHTMIKPGASVERILSTIALPLRNEPRLRSPSSSNVALTFERVYDMKFLFAYDIRTNDDARGLDSNRGEFFRSHSDRIVFRTRFDQCIRRELNSKARYWTIAQSLFLSDLIFVGKTMMRWDPNATAADTLSDHSGRPPLLLRIRTPTTHLILIIIDSPRCEEREQTER